MNKTLTRLLACVAAVACVACSSTKRMQEYNDKTSARAQQEQYGATIQNAFIFDRLQTKVKFSVAGLPGINGRLNIEQGKRFRLILTMPIIGNEVGRIEVDRDSLTVVNKIGKTYAVESLDKMKIDGSKTLDVDLLSCLFLGRIYLPGRGEAHVNDYKRLEWQRQDDGTMRGEYLGERYQLHYTIDDKGHLLETRVTTDNEHVVAWRYADFHALTDGTIPGTEALSVAISTAKDQPREAQLTLSATNVKADKWDPFDPDDRYRRVAVKDLLTALKKLLDK